MHTVPSSNYRNPFFVTPTDADLSNLDVGIEQLIRLLVKTAIPEQYTFELVVLPPARIGDSFDMVVLVVKTTSDQALINFFTEGPTLWMLHNVLRKSKNLEGMKFTQMVVREEKLSHYDYSGGEYLKKLLKFLSNIGEEIERQQTDTKRGHQRVLR